MIQIDGSHGEGGGQVIRTALALSALTGQSVQIDNIRANRPNPGLAAQHLAGLLAMAQIVDADVTGASVGSQSLTFRPQRPPQPGDYRFDVAELAKRGSAGAVTLLFQTIWLPLALSQGQSVLHLHGGTHVDWSPPYHYIEAVYLPTVARMGFSAQTALNAWGFYPVGGGAFEATITGHQQPSPLTLTECGDLLRIWGLAVAAELPAHIAQRITNRASNVLKAEGLPVEITPQRVKSAGPGAGIFLIAEYENAVAGFSTIGAKGKPSDQVADEACRELIRHHRQGAAVDPHLADQLLLPLALTPGRSTFRTSAITQHLLTNAQLIRRFLPVEITINGAEGEPGEVWILRQ
ncbi:MAG: RNA 3'-phosphate cyclase [Caldilineaceae bacterium]|nr:RNA 3'-phosphate cyclase [Caldilineaceae bacterium]